jgi:hypothetical protein
LEHFFHAGKKERVMGKRGVFSIKAKNNSAAALGYSEAAEK